MPDQIKRPPEAGTDDAINQVLVAEHKAREAVARAEAAAAEQVAKARMRARRIEERADARASRLRAGCREWATSEVAKRRAEAERVLACAVEDDERRNKLRAAITRLAAELTGGAP
jgi:vacuolar-type H+-ATPase subunit H